MRISGQISKLTDTLGKSATPILKKCVHVVPVDAMINSGNIEFCIPLLMNIGNKAI